MNSWKTDIRSNATRYPFDKMNEKKKKTEKTKKNADRFHPGGYYRRYCIGTTLLDLVSIPVSLMTAELLSDVADAATGGDFPAVLRKSLTVIGVILTVFVVRSGIAMWQHRESTVAGNRCRVAFLGMFLRNPAHRLFTADEGEINENLKNDLNACADRYKKLIPSVLTAALSVAVYTAFLSWQSLLVGATLFGVSLIQIVPPVIVKKYLEKFDSENWSAEAQESDHIAAAVDGFDVIRLYGLVPWWQNRLEEIQKRLIRAGNGAETTCTAEDVLFKTVDNILRFGTYAALGFFAMKQWIAMETVVKAVCLSAELFAGVRTLFETIPDFGVASQAQRRLDRWGAPASPGPADIPPVEALSLRDARYRAEETEIIRGVSVRFREGENYLLAGANGAGKSTLLHLLTGLVLPTDGQAQWEDRYAQSIPISAAPDEVMLIPQQDPQFHFSAVELFAMFDAAKRDAMVRLAARFGLAEERLSAPIAELSGGERKKVFLSMGFGASSRWLLLDEPTNSLDEAGKQVLTELIRRRGGVLAVSHDPALSPAFRHTLTVEGGRLA